jgi:hypothetical protein
MKLPSRRELPDYYEIIKKPLDIKKILQRIDEGKVRKLRKGVFYINSSALPDLTEKPVVA